MLSLFPLFILCLFLPFGYATGDPNITCKSTQQLLEGLVNSTGWQPPIDLIDPTRIPMKPDSHFAIQLKLRAAFDLLTSTKTPFSTIPDADFTFAVFDNIITLTGNGHTSCRDDVAFERKLQEFSPRLDDFSHQYYGKAEADFLDAVKAHERSGIRILLSTFFFHLADTNSNDRWTCPKCQDLKPHVKLETIEAILKARDGFFHHRLARYRHSRKALDELRVLVQKMTMITAFAAHICNELQQTEYKTAIKERFSSILRELSEWEKTRATEANRHEVLQPLIKDYLKEHGMAVLDWSNGASKRISQDELGELAGNVAKNISIHFDKTIAVFFLDYGTTVLAFTGLAFDEVFSFPLENERKTRVYVFVTNRFEYKLDDALDSGAMQTWTDELVCPEGGCRSHVSYSEFFDFFWPKLQPRSEINYFGLTWSSSYMREARVQPPSSTAQFGLTFGWRSWGRRNWIFSRSGVQVVFGMKSVRRRT